MAPIDGAIGLKLNICNAYTTDVNISKAQPSKASGLLGGVRSLRSKSAPTLGILRWNRNKRFTTNALLGNYEEFFYIYKKA